jgi:chromosome partitioning protein
MGKVYVVANAKGGVGKTTTAYNTAYARAENGKKVLMVELDQQGNLALCAGLRPETLTRTIYDIMKSYAFSTRQKPPIPMSSVVYEVRANLDIVPANNAFASFDIDVVSAPQREYILQRALAPLKEEYDDIFLDCPPNLGLIVLNALVAADQVLVPLQTDYLATQGIRQLLETVEFVQDRFNENLTYAGIVLTQADERTKHTRQIVQKARSDFDGKIHVFSEVVRMSTRVKEAPIAAQSVMEYDPDGQAAHAYRIVAKELDRG